MLTEKKLKDYLKEHKVTWKLQLPVDCPPEDILVSEQQAFFRMTAIRDSLQPDDLKTFSEIRPNRDYGIAKNESFGLSLSSDRKSLEKTLKLPEQKRKPKGSGIAEITLNAEDGVVKNTFKKDHYTWWMTTSFRPDKENIKMVTP